MRLMLVPWLELAILTTLVGSVVVRRMRNPGIAWRYGVAFTGFAFAFSFLEWLGFHLGITSALAAERLSLQPRLFGSVVFGLDELSAPLVPVVALLHFLTAVATARTRMRYFSFSWSLASETIRLTMFSCTASWTLIALLSICTIPPYFELRDRNRPTRVYAIHMIAFVVLIVIGWAAVEAGGSKSSPSAFATVPLLLAIFVRCGTVPAHVWVTDWFEHASFGNGLLFVAPLAGVYAAVRLVLPIAPEWMLHSIGFLSLLTAVYAAGMSTIQRESRRFFAYLFISNASLVLVGLELSTALSLTGSLCLWFSVILSLGGFGLTLRAIESRFGRLSLAEFHGLYEHSPTLGVCYLLTGLATVGFPGTLGFISTELLVDSAVEVNPSVGILVVTAAAINGISVMRSYFRLFTGARYASTVAVGIGRRERFAVLTFAALILGGGLFPQPGVTTRYHAAERIVAERAAHGMKTVHGHEDQEGTSESHPKH